VDALPKGYPQGADGAREASESSPFQSAAAFLAKIREQAIGASRAGLSLRDCLKSLASPKTKAVEAYEGGKVGLFRRAMPVVSTLQTPLSDFLDSFSKR
jgi:hypothetical protein